jgi:imidazolonepropionase
MQTLTLVEASELITGKGFRRKDGRKVVEADMDRIPRGALVISTRTVSVKGRRKQIPGEVLWTGPTNALPKRYLKGERLDLKGQKAIAPGFVDCHTHLVFSGDRAAEFAARCGGATYEEIAAKGGGIVRTVAATREASLDELFRLACQRVKEGAAFGVRTFEVKSGYGLSVESELKILEVIPRLRARFPEFEFVSTFLGAHAFPKESSREEYLRLLMEKMLPLVAKKKLAESCDVFIDRGYYTLEEGRRLLKRARELGLSLKIHADELANTESSKLAAEMGALSADHLLCISERGIQALSKSKTVAVLLPATAFYLKTAQAPARKLIDSGARVALATDFNPGTSMTLNLPVVMTLGALYLQMTAAEILAAVTYNAAAALGREDRQGTLEVGQRGLYTLIPFKSFEEAYYRFAWRPKAYSESWVD